MTRGTTITIVSAFGVIIAHFFYQLMQAQPNWDAAMERRRAGEKKREATSDEIIERIERSG